MFFLICALPAEAKPLIHALSLRKDQVSYAPYETYFSEDSSCMLVISGTGPIAAASAVTYLLTKNGFDEKKDFLLNFGCCAGSSSGLYLINKITDSVSGRSFYPDMSYDLSSAGLPLSSEKALTTCYQVVSDLEDPDRLYDMEASGIYSAASRFAPPQRMLFLKFVTDQGVDGSASKRITASEVTAAAESYVPAIRALMDLLSQVRETVLPFDSDLFSATNLELHASETMSHELRQLFRYASASGQDIAKIISDLHQEEKLPAGSKREGKAVLDELRKRLL